MAQIINIAATRRAVSNRRIADYFASNEISDFDEIWKLLTEQSKYSVLFEGIDFDKYYNLIYKDMQSRHFAGNQELSAASVNQIVQTYSERLDIDELRKELEDIKQL